MPSKPTRPVPLITQNPVVMADWFIRHASDSSLRLMGETEPGKTTCTSKIMSIIEDIVITRSGSRYKLGAPHQAYFPTWKRWLRDKGMAEHHSHIGQLIIIAKAKLKG